MATLTDLLLLHCPICDSKQVNFFHKDKRRSFYHCQNCDLIFADKESHLSPEYEKIEYDHHQNDPSHEGYKEFLSKLTTPLKKYLKPKMKGLDFGSGPGPVLNLMLEEMGYEIDIYDPYYANTTASLSKQYDFVTSTEVVEHFYNPKESWQQLISLVKPKGFLAIMTLFHDISKKPFSDWWYKNNLTHVAFYSNKTLNWIENHYNLSLLYTTDRVAIFEKNLSI